MRERAVGVLRRALDEESGWTKVHAAEYLLALDYPDGVQDVFERELARANDAPGYRVGVWKVLALASAQEEERDRWIGKIRDACFDDGPDRLQAVEALASLHYQVPDEQVEMFSHAAQHEDGPLAAYVNWLLAGSGKEFGEVALAGLLRSDEPASRAAAAYAIRHLSKLSPSARAKLAGAAVREPAGSSARVFLAGAAAVHAPDDYRAVWRDELRAYAEYGTPDERREACRALGAVAQLDDRAFRAQLLDDADAEVRIAAARAILRVERRRLHHVPPRDWAVIVVYGVGMLAVGWYYSRRTTTTEDYLLGGRNMKWLSVGLSLFATLLSTISYLSWPGETISHGPLFMLGAITAYPFVFLVAGWLLIPFIMKLRVTSAYEILESRLGASVRLLGSFLFLALRLGWMAVIIFATSDKVLVPLMGWPPTATPYVCLVLGAITVVYTSMGGLRAVVFTDVVQTAILFGGAVLTLVLVTVYLGGVGAWWPTSWPAHWPKPVWGYAPGARITFFGGFLAMFTWYVCTSGSDQMAVQRYLATRDARAARRVLATSLTASAVITLIMISVGMAVMAYFRANPYLIPDGQTMLGDADKLFPSFIVFGVPMGLSGLIVAGLLAAAMSSLSSGVNSSCSVITVDFLDRFRARPMSEADHVRLAKYVSVIVGAVVVALSSGVGMVHGNLLEVAFKVVNLLTAPIFGLFFMAMFVRWATAFGTLVGAVFGLAVVVAINYWAELRGVPGLGALFLYIEDLTGTQGKGISFLWAMPLSFVVQTAVGMLVSLVPVGRKAGDWMTATET
jgi:SSS family solute:Na+ symporter